jgi:hypothetical protein
MFSQGFFVAHVPAGPRRKPLPPCDLKRPKKEKDSGESFFLEWKLIFIENSC